MPFVLPSCLRGQQPPRCSTRVQPRNMTKPSAVRFLLNGLALSICTCTGPGAFRNPLRFERIEHGARRGTLTALLLFHRKSS